MKAKEDIDGKKWVKLIICFAISEKCPLRDSKLNPNHDVVFNLILPNIKTVISNFFRVPLLVWGLIWVTLLRISVFDCVNANTPTCFAR